MHQYDLLVVGAGISGLGIATFARQAGLRTLVVEQSDRPGGCFHSERFPRETGEFWLELGAHTCYNSYGTLVDLLQSQSLLPKLTPRAKVPFRLLVDGKLASIPSQLSLPELCGAPLRLFRERKGSRTVGDYYQAIVGPTNYRTVFAPAFNAVISQPADEVPADLLFKRRPRRKDILRSFTLAGGLQTLTDALASQPGLELRTNCSVLQLERQAPGFRARLADGTTATCRGVALATPSPAAAELLRPLLPSVAELLELLEVATIDSVGIMVPAEQLQLPTVAGIIAQRDKFFSAVARDTVPDERHRGFCFHFPGGESSPEEQLACIARVLGTSVATCPTARRRSVLPAPRPGHGALVAVIDRLLASQAIALTGNYFTGMAIEDCLLRSAGEFSRLARLLQLQK